MTQLIRVTSIQSPNADFICRGISEYLSARLGIRTEFVNDIPWPEREALLDTGDIQVGWMCGLPYVWKADQARPTLELAAAPVMQAARYQQRPIYFSDMVVFRDSPYFTFGDLRGTTWAYNEPHSQSGYNVTRYHLARLGETHGYFGRVIEAGSHLKALEMVLARQVDASAIDSTVLELELAARPALREDFRIIDVLGPSPIPPWVVTRRLPPEMRDAIRSALWGMHRDPEGRAILRAGQIDHLARVEDRDYDAIRDMARQAAQVKWQAELD